MQALHFCFGFGGIISPLVTEPFLAEKTCVPASSLGTSDCKSSIVVKASLYSKSLKT